MRRCPQIYVNNASPADLNEKCKQCLQMCFQFCLDISALEPLLYAAPPDILEIILRQLSKVLPNDSAARRIFQTTGGLKKIQEIRPQANKEAAELIDIINSFYSQEIVKYYASSVTLGGTGAGGISAGAGGDNSINKANVSAASIVVGGDSFSQRLSKFKPQVNSLL